MWSTLDFLKFIAEWDFFETVPNIELCLKPFLAIYIFVASYERRFSKLKLKKRLFEVNNEPKSVSDLDFLSIENNHLAQVDYDLLAAPLRSAVSGAKGARGEPLI